MPKKHLDRLMSPHSPRWGRSTGFTLLELLIVLSIIGLIIAGTVQAIAHFRKAFDSGEQNTEMMREVSRFVEYLRKDLHVAAPTLTPGTTFRETIRCTSDELTFPAFIDDDGTMALISYQVKGHALQRTLANGSSLTLINGSVASLTWTLQEDGTNQGSSFQAGRIWIHLDAVFGKVEANGKLQRGFTLSTNLFPVRWNQKVHRSPSAFIH